MSMSQDQLEQGNALRILVLGTHHGTVGWHSLVKLETTLVLLCLVLKGRTSLGQMDTERDTGSLFHNKSVPLYDEGYSVYSPSCRMSDFPPFHESMKHIYEKRKEVLCSSLPLLTNVSRKEGGHVLHLHKQHFALYSEKNRTICSYRKIWRADNSDDMVKYGEWIEFQNDVRFDQKDEFIHVKCVVNISNQISTVYNNMHACIGLKPEVERKKSEAHTKWNTEGKPLSIMIVGFDSISRLNMIRTMPKTVKLLERNGWVSFNGYNKIGDNTLPNVMAVLTGMNMQQINDACWPTPNMSMDACPIIWKNISQHGYITAYAEDEPGLSTFNYYKAGFTEPPTDYYLRPFMLAAHQNTTLKYVSELTFCMGPISAADHIFSYSLEFASTFRNYPTFSLFWFNGFSHNDINTPTMMDTRVESYFKSLEDTGALNTTMVIFLSDHGIRFGKIRETYIGHMEERLPFLYFWLPKWFKTAYPKETHNLAMNANRLTSPFDVHMTLADVLGVQTVAEGCPKCMSLFEEVPWNRACMDAGITDHWCTCAEYKTVLNESAPVQAIAEFVVKEINSALQKYTADLRNGTRCSTLTLKEVVFTRSRFLLKPSDRQTFLIALRTSPGDALFEATVSQKNATFNVEVGDISRINAYSGQTHCMRNTIAKKYCKCENTIHVIDNKTNTTEMSTHILPVNVTDPAAEPLHRHDSTDSIICGSEDRLVNSTEHSEQWTH